MPQRPDTEPYERMQYALQLIARQCGSDVEAAAQARVDLQRWRAQSLAHEKIARAAQRGWDMTDTSKLCTHIQKPVLLVVTRHAVLRLVPWFVLSGLTIVIGWSYWQHLFCHLICIVSMQMLCCPVFKP